MKKIKMLACMLMSVAMVLMLGVSAFAAAAADPTITITPKDNAEHTFEAYQIFKGELLGETTVKDAENNDVTKTYVGSIKWGDGVNEVALLTELEANEAFNVVKDGETVNAFKGLSEADDPAAAVAQVLNDQLTNKDFYDAFADVAKTCLTTVKYTATCNNGADAVITIPEAEAGYYLIKDEDGSLAGSEGAYTDFILKVVKDVTVAAKSDAPTVDKKIVEGANKVTGNIASIGDTINYEITSTVPNMEGYNKYFFIMNDTMDKGLTFVDDSVKITVGGVVLTADTAETKGGYKLTTGTDDETGATTLKIVFRDFVNNYTEGDAIVVTYDAILNKDANITTFGNENKVYLTFSNNPNHTYTGKPGTPGDPEEPDEPNEPDDGDPEPTGETPKKVVTTYTTGIELIKVDASVSRNRLAGAQFQISGTKLNTILTTTYTYNVKADGEEGGYYKKADGSFTTNALDADADETQEYTRVAITDEMVIEEAVSATLEVGADGTLIIKGLNAGDYEISEVKAPEGGYNMLNAPIKVTIGGTVDQNALTCDWNVNVTLDGETLATVLDDDVYAFNIVNYKGILLPDAGSIGTTIIYMLGAASVIASLLYFRSRRKAMHK